MRIQPGPTDPKENILKKFKKDVHITANPPEESTGVPSRATNRLRIDSWERSNLANGRAGDAIALHWMRPEAKAFIGWWDTTDPENPTCKAWIGAHDEANNPNASPHRHFSVEVPDSEGHMHTRLAVPYDLDHTNITTSSADFTVVGGNLRVPRSSSLEFSVNKDASRGSRWKLRMTSDESLELTYFESSDTAPQPVAKLNSESGRLEVESLGAVDLILTDRSTGVPNRLYIDNGQIHVEELEPTSRNSE